MINKKAVGRPVKYKDDAIRREIRKKQNRENQQRCRRRKKLKDELANYTANKNHFENNYLRDLIKYVNEYDFDYFFTGTIDPSNIQIEELGKKNDEIVELNIELDALIPCFSGKKMGINSIKCYTNKYIQFLNEKSLFERCFTVFESGKNGQYHVHILFKSSPQIINFIKSSQNFWLIGNSVTQILEPVDQLKVISYACKELRASSKKQIDLNKIDSWFLEGNFNNVAMVV